MQYVIRGNLKTTDDTKIKGVIKWIFGITMTNQPNAILSSKIVRFVG